MLTPSEYDHLCDQLITLYTELDRVIVEDIVRRMLKEGRVTDMAKWQAERLQEAGLLYEDVIAEIAARTNASQAQVRALFEDAGVQCIRNDNVYYQAAGLGGIIRMSDAALQVLNAGYVKCTGNLQNLTLTTANLLTDCRPTRLDGQGALDWIFDGIHGSKPQGFVYRSGISRTRTAYYIHQSVTAALLGADNAFVNRWGGVLYRDNFYFSLHAQMEYSRDTGVIRYGFNMTEIKMTVDDSECITYLMAEDNFGNSTIIRNDDVPNAQFPHHRCRYVKFNYEEADRAQFLEDAQAYFDNYRSPAVNIKVKFANIRGNDLYKDFLELSGYEVGDRVIVYHKDLGISYENLEIISKTQDAVNGETADIEIGSFRNAIVRESYMAGLTSAGSSAESKQLAAMQEQLDQTTAKQLMYWDNLEDYTWDELEQYTWDMLEGEY